ncbi:hypothetical protein AL037_16280 [Salipiger aestuarii]|nr:hypothetical protein AL037_16280 [Salipiger aestuarii]
MAGPFFVQAPVRSGDGSFRQWFVQAPVRSGDGDSIAHACHARRGMRDESLAGRYTLVADR